MLKKIVNQILITGSRYQAFVLKAKVKSNPYVNFLVSRPIQQTDKTFSESHDSVYKLFDSLGARYTDKNSNPNNTMLALPANKLYDLLKQLSFIESNGLYPISFKVYGDKVIRKDFYSVISIPQALSISNILSKKTSFYLQILHQDSEGKLSNIFSKEIFLLNRNTSSLYTIKANSHVSCQKIHKSDIDYVFPQLNCNDDCSYIDSQQDVSKKPVDVVITWVDKSDAKWQNLWKKRVLSSSTKFI